jgi:hypothetical protein
MRLNSRVMTLSKIGPFSVPFLLRVDGLDATPGHAGATGQAQAVDGSSSACSVSGGVP